MARRIGLRTLRPSPAPARHRLRKRSSPLRPRKRAASPGIPRPSRRRSCVPPREPRSPVQPYSPAGSSRFIPGSPKPGSIEPEGSGSAEGEGTDSSGGRGLQFVRWRCRTGSHEQEHRQQRSPHRRAPLLRLTTGSGCRRQPECRYRDDDPPWPAPHGTRPSVSAPDVCGALPGMRPQPAKTFTGSGGSRRRWPCPAGPQPRRARMRRTSSVTRRAFRRCPPALDRAPGSG